MNAEDQHDTDPVKDPLKELADGAAGKTIAAVYAAWQGGEMQFGTPVFHDRSQIVSRKPNHGVSFALQRFAMGIPPHLATSVFKLDQPVPYHLYGVFFKDVPGGVTTIVTGGKISWESGPASLGPKGVTSGRSSTPTAICMQLQDTGHTTDRYINYLQNQPTDILYKYLKHPIFSQSWLNFRPSGGLYDDSYQRSTTTGYFKFAVDGVDFKELHSPFQFTPTGIKIPTS